MARTPKMDRNEYDYEPMDLPNVLAAHVKNNPKLHSHTAPVLVPVILPLARARPNWTFAAEECGVCSLFNVFLGRDYLGSIYSRGFYDNKTIGIKNHRLQKQRVRRGDVRTTLPKKAIKLVLETFGALSNEEYLTTQAPVLKTEFNGLAYQKGREFAVGYDKLEDPVKDYLFSNWDTSSRELLRHGAKPKDLAGLDEKMVDYKTVNTGLATGGRMVVIRGSSYFVSVQVLNMSSPITGLEYTEHTSDSLPPHIREGVGLLKLSPDNTYIENVGYRKDAELFFVTRSEV